MLFMLMAVVLLREVILVFGLHSESNRGKHAAFGCDDDIRSGGGSAGARSRC
ncbi:hypothetical protein DPMN_016245 [Dreissena polymorpha]|uniref:Uncharacterized protein n=1 Tax=Dreissena polymorpha TaxID=45954 RepID=A0A9D4NCS6_DREPO|nr:hypothetical protein DPMN_016245 [Dreissena polymorpha]